MVRLTVVDLCIESELLEASNDSWVGFTGLRPAAVRFPSHSERTYYFSVPLDTFYQFLVK